MLRSLSIVLSAASVVGAAESMLVSADWLASRLHDPEIVILHVGSQKDYEAGHIPGARLVTLADISVTDTRGMRLQLPSTEALVSAFSGLGVSDGSRIVVYPATESLQSATRVWFTLDYLGAGSRTSLLDGGLAVWRSEGRSISVEPPAPPRRGVFTANVRSGSVVDAAWVQSHLRDATVSIVDARTPEYYSGASAGAMPRSGRIPGARNVPFNALISADRKLLPETQLRSLLEPGKIQVTYCHIGQQATVPYFVARYLGLDAKLYDGSFQDWSSRPDLAVE